MRALFSDVLPDPVLARSSKVFFDRTRFGAGERTFAAAWTGEGVDPDLVDPNALRRHWLEEQPPLPNSMSLLHQAWLATEGR